MKTFRSLVVLKRPHAELWTVMRDHLVDISPHIADIEDIRQLERTIDADGVIHITNQWHVRHQVPPMIRSILKTSELSWIDRNTWDARTLTCSWTIEPNFLTGYIDCSGQTGFASAMGGQGARVTFEGGLDLKPGLLGGSLGGIEKLVSGFIESIVTTVIPRNLRGVVEAAAAFEVPKAGS
ncbi:MAG TPA: hypothetical protein VHT74_29050 [Acetobacteraceae bacterium]|nr:hypothetical protein [Acetobacteraceae bacterium]